MVTRIALSRYYMHTPCAVDIIAMYYCKINHGNLSDKALTTGYSVPYMQLRAFFKLSVLVFLRIVFVHLVLSFSFHKFNHYTNLDVLWVTVHLSSHRRFPITFI